MADIEYTYGVYGDELYAEAETPQDGEHVAHGRDRGALGRMVNVAGALASLALVVGVGVWGYKLMVRDVSGVPVVRALEGPMRVPPEDPGGEAADHQGLAVNAVAAQGTAAPPPDRLALAPRPIGLADEDVPMAPSQSKDAQLRTAAVDPGAVDAFRDGSVDALVRQLTDGVAPLGDAAADRIAQPEALELGDGENDTASESEQFASLDPEVLLAPGVKVSPRPMLRPARLDSNRMSADVAAALSAAQDAMASTDLDVEAETLGSGTRLAQLGAYDSPEIAREEWDRLYDRFGDYMDGKKRVIQKASSGGRTFYRLRAAGFADLSDARRFCSALVAENADCIPVTVR